MKVRLLTALAGATMYNAGDEYECEPNEAQRLVSRGFAEYIRDEAAETAVVIPKTETTARRRTRRK